jgi:hypothetical protein
MTAAKSAYPVPPAELVERVRALASELGEWPSQRRVMRACRVGAPRAEAALAALREEGFAPAPRRGLAVVPDTAETQPDDAQEPPSATAPGVAEGAAGDAAQDATAGAEIDGEPLVTDATGAEQPPRTRRPQPVQVPLLITP